eukprot:Nitzschia sp. Nitz4//scaffold111_size72815//23262//24098//NITZ4_005784-RA/size72815-processed-gene-0.64-mRNA-1//-1//CDS//3329533162//8264//frame0
MTMIAPQMEKLYVLYASQTGNSEQAAQDFCKQLQEKYNVAFFKTRKLPILQIETICVSMDDFLELQLSAFSKCVVIFTSSYGEGQAPLGGYLFRRLCDFLLGQDDDPSSQDDPKKIKDVAENAPAKQLPLEGLHYAICGLGNSSYPTYLKNPITIDKALTASGAIRIGELGKADAKNSGDNAQDKMIEKWIETIWVPLAKKLAKNDPPVDTKPMQAKIISHVMKLDPSFKPPNDLYKAAAGKNAPILPPIWQLIIMPLLGIIIGFIAIWLDPRKELKL